MMSAPLRRGFSPADNDRADAPDCVSEGDAHRHATNTYHADRTKAHELPALHVVDCWPHLRHVFFDCGHVALKRPDTIDELIHALMHCCSAAVCLDFGLSKGIPEIADFGKDFSHLLMQARIKFWRQFPLPLQMRIQMLWFLSNAELGFDFLV